MTNILSKERFLDICHFKTTGDLCMLSTFVNLFNPQTPKKWIEQGAPKEIVEPGFIKDFFQIQDIHGLFKINSGINFEESASDQGETLLRIDLGHDIIVPARAGSPIVPPFKHKIISEDERSVTLRNATGQTVKYIKEALKSGFGMPMFLDWPVKNRDTWNEFKKRLDPNTLERWPSDWDSYVKKMNSKNEPLSLEVGSFFGFLRDWVGSEKILYMFYDDPNLIEDMMEQILYLEIEVIKRVLKDIKIQQASFWEDMAYKAGPLISPAMVRKYMMPRYRKITDLLHSHGVDVIYVDSDGNVEQLIPLWLEVGINFVWPFEVAAGNDVVTLRKKYGKNLIISGGIDKRVFIRGKKAIHEEVMSKVPFLLSQGGYFPSIDHSVSPDITFENYCYFINLVREIAGLDKLSFC